MQTIQFSLLCVLVLVPATTAHAQQYVITDLGTLGGTYSEASDISDSGQIIGMAFPEEWDPFRAFFWQDGAMIELPAPDGLSVARGVNAAGDAVGFAADGQAALWQNGQYFNLAELSGLAEVAFSGASDINNTGQIAGDFRAKQSTIDQAVRWSFVDGQWSVTTLDLLDLPDTEASAINDAGLIVGQGKVDEEDPVWPEASVWHAALWDAQGNATDLGTLGGARSRAADINNHNQVVGRAETGETFMYCTEEVLPVSRGFMWQNGELFDLGSLGGSVGAASAINDNGQIVGLSLIGDACGSALHPFLWQEGVMIDLNDVIPEDSGWLELENAVAINNAGQIVGQGWTEDFHEHAFLLTPCAPADFDCDGIVGPFDLAQLLAAWGPCADPDDCPADLNGDGTVGPFDLAQLLGNWGEYP
ncbi:MAG: hypothetical protein IID34_06370 [Planctomycetes bacterium]|nr:hypothetical protein [Planctomycetota bacterium]